MKLSEAIRHIRTAHSVFAVVHTGIPIRVAKGEAEAWARFSTEQRVETFRGTIRVDELEGDRHCWLGCASGQLIEPDNAPSALQGGGL